MSLANLLERAGSASFQQYSRHEDYSNSDDAIIKGMQCCCACVVLRSLASRTSLLLPRDTNNGMNVHTYNAATAMILSNAAEHAKYLPCNERDLAQSCEKIVAGTKAGNALSSLMERVMDFLRMLFGGVEASHSQTHDHGSDSRKTE
jgi:hypothetical protein